MYNVCVCVSTAGPAVLDDSGVCEGVDLGASPVLGLPNQSPSQCQNPNPSVVSTSINHIVMYMQQTVSIHISRLVVYM